jgi:hypothetical protein
MSLTAESKERRLREGRRTPMFDTNCGWRMADGGLITLLIEKGNWYEMMIIQGAARPVNLLWGIVVPALIFLFSFVVTYALYRKFSGK